MFVLQIQNIVLMLSCLVLTVGANQTAAPDTNSTVLLGPATNSSSDGSGVGVRTSNLLKSLNVDPSMIRRAMYVLIGITGVGVLYFLVRAVRMKKPQQKKKYGLLANMDLDESDEDETLYEARSLRR